MPLPLYETRVTDFKRIILLVVKYILCFEHYSIDFCVCFLLLIFVCLFVFLKGVVASGVEKKQQLTVRVSYRTRRSVEHCTPHADGSLLLFHWLSYRF